MRSFYDEPRTGSAVLIRDRLADDLVGSFSRHGRARESSIRSGLPRPARSTAGKSSVHVLAAVVAFALTVTCAVSPTPREADRSLITEEAECMSTSKPTRASAAPAAGISDRAMRRPNPKPSWNTSSIRYGTHGPS